MREVACPCGRAIASFHVGRVDGQLVLVVTHEDGVCDLPFDVKGRGHGAIVLRALLRDGGVVPWPEGEAG